MALATSTHHIIRFVRQCYLLLRYNNIMQGRTGNRTHNVRQPWMETKKKHKQTPAGKKIKQSIYRVRVTRLQSYTTTYMNTRATITCHRDNIDNRCDTCYYYKQMTNFVFIIQMNYVTSISISFIKFKLVPLNLSHSRMQKLVFNTLGPSKQKRNKT